MYDIIGDIHGHAEALTALLKKLGYTRLGDSFRHPERKLLFLGDYIDRGPRIPEVLRIVRATVETEGAIALMGNHEYNAVQFHLPHPNGGHLRKHSLKNISQHAATIEQFKKDQKEYEAHLEWFAQLPWYHEADGFRAVHACFEPEHIAALNAETVSGTDRIRKASEKGTALNEAAEILLKGQEINMPEGLEFNDKDGHPRKEMRIRWWDDPSKSTWKSISVLPIEALPEEPVTGITGHYNEEEKPVFFGHYWMTGRPRLQRHNVCCLDFSIAKDGVLACYRYDGENELKEEKLVWV